MRNHYLAALAAGVCLATAMLGAAGWVEPAVAQVSPVKSAVSASSTLRDRRDVYRYSADKAFDGDPTTAWVEGVDGDGIGERLVVHFAERVTIDRIKIMPGLYAERWYHANNRIRQLRVSGRRTGRVLEFPDGMLPRETTFEPIPAFPDYGGSGKRAGLRLEIVSTYAGTRWRDTPIAEIEFYHGDERIEVSPLLSVWPADFTIGAARGSTLFLLVRHSKRGPGDYRLDRYNEMVVVDVTNPARPSLLSTLTLSKDVWVEEDSVTRTDPQFIRQLSAPAGSPYVFALSRGDLHVIDVSQPTAPRAVAMLPVMDEAASLVATRDHVYIAGTSLGPSDERVDDTTRISVVDVRAWEEPIQRQPILLEEVDTRTWSLAVDDVAQRLIAHNSNADQGLRIFDIHPDGSLQEISVQADRRPGCDENATVVLVQDSVLVCGSVTHAQCCTYLGTAVYRLKPDHSLERVPLPPQVTNGYPIALLGDWLVTHHEIGELPEEANAVFLLRERRLRSRSVFASAPSAAELLLPTQMAVDDVTVDALGSRVYARYWSRGLGPQVLVIDIGDIGGPRLLFP